MGIIATIIIGLVSGFIANYIMKGKGSGFIINLLVGLVGSWVGGFLFGLMGLAAFGLIGKIVASVFGAVVLLFAIKKIKG